MSEISADSRRLALEIIATLVNIKRSAADQLLRRAEVSEPLIRRFLTDRDPSTGEKLSKRVAGTMVLDELARQGEDSDVISALIDIAANWDAFHLAADEYKARAIVQKARELQGVLGAHARKEHEAQEARRAQATARQAAEQTTMLTKQSELLLSQFDYAATAGDPHQRGFLLQDLLNRLFDIHRFTVAKAFQRNAGAEQIDGAFEMDGWHYLVECRWRAKPADTRDIDGLLGQVRRSGRQTMGVFLSINGWSEHVIPLLKQNPEKSVLLMDGYDLRAALSRQIDLRKLLQAKVRALNLDAEPFLSSMAI
ncbi:restriction endonuclease [Novosphingobium mathurense]|uniref:Restriction endonuclease n=1 Tax=Novosphingobium mathurense TaxID=428990 RepID=A0A1U6H605_9SPHN|nr:restriction endonuclease [Novosphingobium mathurense]SLJ91205.1 hypothetical protein SAMN06295987_1011337 [Novosphingobium mathurense]